MSDAPSASDPTPDDPSRPKPHGNWLTYAIGGAIIAAIALALLAPHVAESLEVGGELFLRALKMIVVPLVFTSVMCGVLGLGDVRKLGRPGATAIGYYLATTVLAVLVGLVVVNVIRPGEGTVDQAKLSELSGGGMGTPKAQITKALSQSTGLSTGEVASVLEDLPPGESSQPGIGSIFKNLLLMLVTDNLFVAAAETQLLPIIVFAIVFAGMLTTMHQDVSSITTLVVQSNEALMKFVMLLMNIAPLGIFCLVAARFGKAQASGEFLDELAQIGWYFGTVLIGLAIHAFVTLPLIFYLVRRENPYRYMLAMSQALLTAFSTASSSATLPVTLECSEEAGISKRSTEFVIPLGATINMDGTALYEAAAAIFIAQVVPGIDLTLMQQVIVAVTATLAAIGAAGIPEAGLVTMLIVLNAVGLPLEYIGLILTVDWLLDRFRTTVNVLGDSIGAAVVEKSLPDALPASPAAASAS
ncbi:dicarboxylate/amino acid:cation symporter [Roseiconus nitratireducens]|uniref:Dicarboxylate/amino acid:cation symporter n=1 Tax=Roseiconus nitratireducens TaxID=2605748 RepID=A0A5M6DGQ0_9BACT|nr:dicarboxylate/amino acid:cation symporter [Roseiconus nitratireducens]KAA5545460.1 dicarboxylate/amino acid:cation symporter [Roseiconus nitratireducens]